LESKLLALLIPLSDQDYKEDSSLQADLNTFKSEITKKFKEQEHKCLQEEAHYNRNMALLCALPIFTAPFALPVALWFEYHRRDYKDKMNYWKEICDKDAFLYDPSEYPPPISPQACTC